MKLISLQKLISFSLLVIIAISTKAQPIKTSSGIMVKVDGREIELAVAKDVGFRISISNSGMPAYIPSIFLDKGNTKQAKCSIVSEPPVYGIKTSYGKLVVNTDTKTWALYNASGVTLIQAGVFNTAGTLQQFSFPTNSKTVFYGSGNYSTKDLVKHGSAAAQGNGTTDIPYCWNSGGYSVLGISEDDDMPAQWNVDSAANVHWKFPGKSADLYIWPAISLYEAATGFAALTGKPALPPEWAFGYLQSQWGWQDRPYIEDVLHNFRARKLPVDAFIYDFEWYTTLPDYALKKSGDAGFTDFSFNPKLFPDAASQIADYKKQGIKFIGIRKPRLGNTALLDLARKNGWLKSPETDSRDLDFSNDTLRQWYAEQNKPLLEAGAMDAWWNDEGESYYTCYYGWNKAEAALTDKVRPNSRYFSINRAFSPGNQRYGYTAWTGDILSTWQSLRTTPADLLNFSLAGICYGSCDIGGFGTTAPTKETLVRWFQAGVFFPIMRSHSNLFTKPHFPWLWDADGEAAIRKALNLRYQLLPYIYSLGHQAYTTGIPIMRPLVMEFQNDPAVANITDEWLLGKGLLAAPLLDSGGTRSIYLPDDVWYDFNTGKAVPGHSTFMVTKALDEIPVYVRAGTILPLGPVIQYTGQDTSAPLELRIYPGHDGLFTLAEDDDKSYDYTKGIVRTTTFTWNDAGKTLSWKTGGKYEGKKKYNTIKLVLGDVTKKVAFSKKGSVVF